jgi:hypothetical protein
MSELLECANRDMQTTENKQKTKKARPIFILGFYYCISTAYHTAEEYVCASAIIPF